LHSPSPGQVPMAGTYKFGNESWDPTTGRNFLTILSTTSSSRTLLYDVS